MSEIHIQHDIMRALGTMPFCRIWRQNVGMGYSYHQVKQLIGMVSAVQLQSALSFARTMRPISYGVPGMPDIGGVLIDGRSLGIEVKTATGRQSSEQIAYQKMMTKFGGLYIVARSADDALNQLALEGYTK
jgi:hypothetical protein